MISRLIPLESAQKYFKNPQFSLAEIGRNKDDFKTYTIGVSVKIAFQPYIILTVVLTNS